MKLRSLYILSIVGLLLVIVVQIGGMMYAYDNTKKEAERALNECFRLAFIETVDNEINNLPFPDMTIPFYSYLSKDSIRSFEDEMFLNYQQAASFLEDVYHVAIPLDVMARLVVCSTNRLIGMERMNGKRVLNRLLQRSKGNFWRKSSRSIR